MYIGTYVAAPIYFLLGHVFYINKVHTDGRKFIGKTNTNGNVLHLIVQYSTVQFSNHPFPLCV